MYTLANIFKLILTAVVFVFAIIELIVIGSLLKKTLLGVLG